MSQTLTQLIAGLVELEKAGHGDKQVFGMCGSSGVAYEVGSARIDDEEGEAGPFDLNGAKYVSIYLGN